MDNKSIGPELERIAKRCWQQFVNNAVVYIVGFLVVGALGSITFGVLLGPLTVGYIRMVQRGLAGEEIAVGDVFAGFEQFGASFVAMLLILLGVSIGFMVLVLPGLAVLFVTFFVMHVIAYEKAGVGRGFSRSWELVKANPMFTLVLLLVMTAINSLGGLVAVGVLLTGPLSLIGLTVAYEALAGAVRLPESSAPQTTDTPSQ